MWGRGNTPTCVGKTHSSRALRRSKRKHPHVRGEDQASVAEAFAAEETPPRAWGRPRGVSCGPPRGGNTPTCVGKTGSSPALGSPWWKHPHVRGEDQRMLDQAHADQETPPRAWGRPFPGESKARQGGNTPTCVGKTSRTIARRMSAGKHPHVRGEDSHTPSLSTIGRETPPRAWGRLLRFCKRAVCGGNTPTCVGKTQTDIRSDGKGRKHPHVRGEDWCHWPTRWPVWETPPRAWGRLVLVAAAAKAFGNTPTCVGKTPLRLVSAPWIKKHPHVRGEDWTYKTDIPHQTETPPRAWGRRQHRQLRHRRSRNTPTCVGKTRSSRRRCLLIGKHPHVRGEDTNKLLRSPITDTRSWGYADTRVSTTSCKPEMFVIGFRRGPMVLIS